MSTDKHGAAGKMFHLAVVYHLQALTTKTLYLGAVVHNVAQTVKTAAARQFLLGGTYSLDHAETIASIIVYPYLHHLHILLSSNQLMLWFS